MRGNHNPKVGGSNPSPATIYHTGKLIYSSPLLPGTALTRARGKQEVSTAASFLSLAPSSSGLPTRARTRAYIPFPSGPPLAPARVKRPADAVFRARTPKAPGCLSVSPGQSDCARGKGKTGQKPCRNPVASRGAVETGGWGPGPGDFSQPGSGALNAPRGTQ